MKTKTLDVRFSGTAKLYSTSKLKGCKRKKPTKIQSLPNNETLEELHRNNDTALFILIYESGWLKIVKI